MRRACLVTLAALISAAFAAARSKRPINFDDVMQIRRISEPDVSPDAKWIAFVMAHVDFAANKLVDHIWLVPINGGEPKELTSGERPDTTPRWSPDGNPSLSSPVAVENPKFGWFQ